MTTKTRSTSPAAPVVTDRATNNRVAARFLEERGWSQPPDDFGEQELFVFDIDTCLVTTTTGRRDPHPEHTVWRADEPA